VVLTSPLAVRQINQCPAGVDLTCSIHAYPQTAINSKCSTISATCQPPSTSNTVTCVTVTTIDADCIQNLPKYIFACEGPSPANLQCGYTCDSCNYDGATRLIDCVGCNNPAPA
ncbi:1930_t:CDS:1, partial [Racocetra persica]